MPTNVAKKKKKSGKAAKAPRTGKKQVEVIKESKHRRLSRQGGAIILFFTALLFAAITIFPGEHVWRFIHEMLLGVFSVCAYIIPAIMIYIAVIAAFEKPVQSLTAKLLEMAGLVFMIDALIHIFTVGKFPSGGFKQLYSSGILLHSGGVAGGIIGAPLCMMFGKVGAIITIVLLTIVLLMLLCEVTLKKLLYAIFPFAKKKQCKEEEEFPPEPEPVKFKHKKPRYNIDVKLDDEPVNSSSDESEDETGTNGRSPELDELVNKAASLAANDDLKPYVVEKKTESVPTVTGVQQKIYDSPPTSLLIQETRVSNADVSEELKGNAATLVDTLKSFGVETRITNICRGPAVTRYELQPSAGVKISRITALADDIALNLASAGVRIEAPIPNKSAVGIEVPNKNVSVVHLREVIESDEFRQAKSKVTIALGRDITGNIVVADIAKMPHMLIAGATGSGKSVCINTIIMSILYKASPEEVKFLMVDPKVVELGIYNGIPHLLVPVVTDPGKAAGALNWAVTEMLGRYKRFADNNVRDIRGYNKLARSQGLEPMPQIVIIIDELSDLMMAAPKDVEDAICRLAQMARAAGMHLVIATQRPSVDVITGVIKANIPSRIAFAVSSQIDSRTILDMGGAEKLLGRGDMLFLPMGASKPIRVQGCYVSDSEVEAVTEYVKKDTQIDYDEEILDEIEKQSVKSNEKTDDASGDADPLLPQAIECVIDAGTASTSMLQRRLKLGYSRAARIIDQMEARGIVSPPDGSKPRQVLMTKLQWEKMNEGSDN